MRGGRRGGTGKATVINNTVTGGGIGIQIAAGSTGTIQNNQVGDAASAVVWAGPSTPIFTGNTFSGAGFRGLRVSGTITSNTHWRAGALTALGLAPVYLIGDNLTVASGAQLRIDPGTVVKFAKRRASNIDEDVGLYVQGALWAQGTAADKIYFTSVDDAAVGGSAGGDGSPDSSDWGWIEFQGSSEDANCLLEHCVIKYGGNDYFLSSPKRYDNYAVRCLDASPTIRNCEITQCRRIIYGGANSSPTITGNTLQGVAGDWGMLFEGVGAPRIAQNTISHSGHGISIANGNAAITNNAMTFGGDGIAVAGGAAMIANNTLNAGSHGITVATGPATILNNQLHVGGNGIAAGAGAVTVSGNTITASGSGTVLSLSGTATVINNTVTGGGIGIQIAAGATGTVQNNQVGDAASAVVWAGPSTPIFSGNTFSGAGFRGLRVSGTITSNTHWQASALTALGLAPVYLITDNLTVASGAQLRIDPGTVVKFAKQRSSNNREEVGLYVQGALWAQGTAADKIYFTSVDDAAVGGSAGGDGSPGSDDWGWIEFQGSSEDANCLLEHCVIRYGGNDFYDSSGLRRYDNYAVRCLDASPTIRNCEITQCRGGIYGVNSKMSLSRCAFSSINTVAAYVDAGNAAGPGPQITANTFRLCPTGIQYYGGTLADSNGTITGNIFENGTTALYVCRVGTSLTVQYNQFVAFSSFGVRNTNSTGTVDARYNWWGDASGPSGQGSGSGCAVSQYVDYGSWWAQPNENIEGVFNVVANRRGDEKIVDIYYDLVGDSLASYRVSIKASRVGGEPYTITPSSGSLSGAVGSGQSVGLARHIVWDARVDDAGQYTDLMRVKVTAAIQ